MKSHVQVAVIGGGVVGCSVLYHLTKLGWKDVVLIERSELTSGSTWHAAGGFHTLNADTNMAALQGYTIRLYKELEQITGLSCGLHHVGGLTLAATPERMDFLKAERAKHQYMGLNTEIVGPDEIKDISPITSTSGILGALFDPLDGHLDPSGTTHAYAKAAKMQGAEIYLHNRVLELLPTDEGHWQVVTEQGTIHAEHVVNAAGLWAREVAEMVGVYLPLHPMEHQYLVTEDIPQVYERSSELPHVMDPEGENYLRQEGRGLVIGFYEQACEHWAVDGTPWDFGHELLPDKLDRIDTAVESAYFRYPCLGKAGIKRVINGPFTFAPDGNPLLGPVPGLRNYWSACAVMAGFSQGGGVGLTLAEWMIEGEPSREVMAMDVARFGDYCTKVYTRAKVKENYQRRFAVAYPNEELPAGRPFCTTPAYGVWKSLNAVFGSAYGTEHVNYFALEGEQIYEEPSFRRSNAHQAVSQECMAVRNSVGFTEIHNFGKYEVTGEDAEKWLNTIFANRMPEVGAVVLSPMLSPKGKIIGDFTVARLTGNTFQLTASFGAQAYHMRWFEQHLPANGVDIKNISLQRVGFQIAGPNARDLLQSLTDEDISKERFGFLQVKQMSVGLVPAIVVRVTYTGDLGYEIYVDSKHQLPLMESLMDVGKSFKLRPFGMRAIMSLRLEKLFGSWMREYKPEFSAAETGLDRFIDYEKTDFIGREVAIIERGKPPQRLLVAFVVEADDADVFGDEPIWYKSDLVGYVTSGGYAHYVKKSVALGIIPRSLVNEGAEFEIEILGSKRKAILIRRPLFDPKGLRMRA